MRLFGKPLSKIFCKNFRESEKDDSRKDQVRRTQFLKIVPNLVIEILSRATAEHGRIEKKTIYEVNGVEEYWLVDPDRRMVTVFHLVGGGYSTGTISLLARSLALASYQGLKSPLAYFFLNQFYPVKPVRLLCSLISLWH